MKSFRLSKCCLSLLAIAGFAANTARPAAAQEKASPSSNHIAKIDSGLPGHAPKNNLAVRANYAPSDPKMTPTTAPAVSLVEHAETAGLKAMHSAIGVVAPWAAGSSTQAPQITEHYIFGKDDRTQVTNTTSFPYTCVCDLQMTFPNGKQYIGTGFFVSYKTVLTAGHCVYDPNNGGWARSIQVIPGRNGNSYPFGSAYGASFTSVTGWTKNGDRAYDYGAITMADTTLGNKVGHFGYAVDSDSFLTSTSNVFNTAGFPGDKGGTTMWYTYGQISSVSANNEYYYFDIMGGQSGSPIWSYQNGNRYVVGIVTAEYTNGSGPNIGTRVNTSVYNFIKGLP